MTNAMVDKEPLEVSLTGHQLLDDPLLNKSSAFSEEERRELGLMGLLPLHTSTIEEQLARVYENYQRKDNDIERYIFLTACGADNSCRHIRVETSLRSFKASPLLSGLGKLSH